MSPWINFTILIGVQLIIALFLIYKNRKTVQPTPSVFVWSAILGLVFGVPIDIIIGKTFGLFGYALAFTPLFLILNGILSYGLWVLTLLLLSPEKFVSYCLWVVGLGILYEIENYINPVWMWTFSSSYLVEEIVVVIFAYGIPSLFAAFLLQRITGVTFHSLTSSSEKI